MSKQKQPKTVRTFFTDSYSLESISKHDKDGLLHGEQRSWWDRNHHYPKELSIYQHGTLIRTIKWHLNGNVQTVINTYSDKKEVFEYYSSGSMKFHQNYKFSDTGFVKHGVWYGLYRSGVKHYEETYSNGELLNATRYYTTGKPIIIDDSAKPIISNDDSTKVEEVKTSTFKGMLTKFLNGFIKF